MSDLEREEHNTDIPYPSASPSASAIAFKTTTNAVTINENEMIAHVLLHSLILTQPLPPATSSFSPAGSLFKYFRSCLRDHVAWKIRINESRHVRWTACCRDKHKAVNARMAGCRWSRLSGTLTEPWKAVMGDGVESSTRGRSMFHSSVRGSEGLVTSVCQVV